MRFCVSDATARRIAQLTTEAALVSIHAISSTDLAIQRETLAEELRDFREGYEECLIRDALDLSKVQVDRQALAWLNVTLERGERVLYQIGVLKKVLKIIISRSKLQSSSSELKDVLENSAAISPNTNNIIRNHEEEFELSPPKSLQRQGFGTSPPTTTATMGRASLDSSATHNSNGKNNDESWEDIEKSELNQISYSIEKVDLVNKKDIESIKMENDKKFTEDLHRVARFVTKTKDEAQKDLETLRSFFESKKELFQNEDIKGKSAISVARQFGDVKPPFLRPIKNRVFA